MRVIAGSSRRTRLAVAPGGSTRPFPALARGALFNSLASFLPEARVLDLYAGSGAMGIEALSRGAASCVFVESGPEAVAVLKENLARCGFEGQGRVLAAPVEKALPSLRGPFDLIFIDPPFAVGSNWEKLPEGRSVTAATSARLSAPGRLVLRVEAGKSPGMWPGHLAHDFTGGTPGPLEGGEGRSPNAPTAPGWGDLVLLWDRRYGRSRVCVYGWESAGAGSAGHQSG